MKKSKNIATLVVGIIVIVIGLLIPLVFTNQKIYYTYKTDLKFGYMEYRFTVNSKRDLDIYEFTVEYGDEEDSTMSIYKSKKESSYVYTFTIAVEEWIDVEDFKIIANLSNGNLIEIGEMEDNFIKIPIMFVFISIGVFLIIVFFANRKNQNSVQEIKEIIGRGILDNGNSEEDSTVQHSPYKECAYCGSQVPSDNIECKSCGAKFKIDKKSS